MDKSTLSHYGFILVATLIIVALMSILSPLSPFGFSDGIREAVDNAIDTFFDRTAVDNVDNPRDPVNPNPNGEEQDRTVIINFIYESGKEASPKQVFTVKHGEKFDAAEIVKKIKIEGYEPNYLPSTQTITKDVEYTIVFLPNTYKIEYETNGGVITSSKITEYTCGEVTPLPSSVTKDGYYFVGWYNNLELEGEKITEIPSTTRGDQKFYAKWSEKTFTVTFISNGKVITGLSPTQVFYGESLSLPATLPSQNGYTFAGWYDNEHCQGTNIAKTPEFPTENLVYYARWTKDGYSITFVTNGGAFTGSYPTAYATGDIVNLPNSIKRTGYTFAGWYSDANCTKAVSQIKATDIGDKTFYAKWIPNVYNITYDANGGTIGTTTTNTFTFGTVVKYPTSEYMTRNGYIFAGWKDTATGQIVTQTPTDRAENIVLIAQWTPKTYAVIYDANGGSPASTTVTLSYNTAYGYPPTVTRTGYELVGWFTAKTGGTEIKPTDIFKLQTTQTLYARWKPAVYSIIYVTDGGKFGTTPTEKYTFGVGATLTTNITKQYHTFDGWYTTPDFKTKITSVTTTQHGNITVYAKWIPDVYNISYDLDGGSVTGNPTKYTYGVGAKIPTPSKPGHTFMYWYDQDNKTITELTITDHGDKKLTAVWKENGISVVVNLVDKNGNPLYYGGKKLTYTFENIVQNEVNSYNANFFAERLGVNSIFYHDAFSFTVTTADYANSNGSTINYNLRAYKYIYFEPIAVDQNGVELSGASKITYIYDMATIFTFKQPKSALHPDDQSKTHLYETATIGSIINKSSNEFYIFDYKIAINGTPYSVTTTNTVSSVDNLLAQHLALDGSISKVLIYYKPQTFNISYDLNGNVTDDSQPKPNPSTQNPSSFAVKDGVDLGTPTRTCYTFAGWTVVNLKTGKTVTLNGTKVPVGVVGDIKATANWTRKPTSTTNNTTGHKYTSAITTQPTCTKTGIRTYTCTFCGIQYTAVEPMLGHSWPTTYEAYTGTISGHLDGAHDVTGTYNGDTYHRGKCQRSGCNEYTVKAHTYTNNHSDYSSTQHRRQCTSSGCTHYEYTNHSWGAWENYSGSITAWNGATKGTYDGNSYHRAKCSVCGAYKVSAHTYGTSYSNYDSNQHRRKCQTCPYYKYENHQWSTTYTRVDDNTHRQTCTLNGCTATKDTSHTYGNYTNYDSTYHRATCSKSGCGDTNDIKHSYTSAVTKAATCTADGVKTYTCTTSTCKRQYTEAIPAIGHAYGAWTNYNNGTYHRRICANDNSHIETQVHSWSRTKNPTCTATGTDTCSICKQTRSVAALGHNYGNWTSISDTQHKRVCANDSSHVETANHSFTTTTAATCTTAGSKKCNTCSKVLSIPATGHAYGAWTNYNNGTYHRRICANDNSHIETQVHSWSRTKNPTCTATGTDTCSTCKQTRSVAAIGHAYGAWTNYNNGTYHRRICANDNSHIETQAHSWSRTTNPTCTATGVDTCSTCKQTRSVAALGHAYGDWVKVDGTNHKRTCSRDNSHTETKAHSYTTSTSGDGTCVSPKVTTYTCSGCNYSYSVSEGGGGHNMSGWSSISDSQHKRTCQNSGCTYSETVAHTLSSSTSAAATCIDAQVTTSSCSVCNYSSSTTTTAAQGHRTTGHCNTHHHYTDYVITACKTSSHTLNPYHEHLDTSFKYTKDHSGHAMCSTIQSNTGISACGGESSRHEFMGYQHRFCGRSVSRSTTGVVTYTSGSTTKYICATARGAKWCYMHTYYATDRVFFKCMNRDGVNSTQYIKGTGNKAVDVCSHSNCTNYNCTSKSNQSSTNQHICQSCLSANRKTIKKLGYNSANNYIVLGYWDCKGATSVDITFSVTLEGGSSSPYDFISFAQTRAYLQGNDYKKTLTYLNQSGQLVSTTGTDNTVKFCGDGTTSSTKLKTYTFTNVPMTYGAVIFKSDSSGYYGGVIVTIKPNYDP